MYFYIWRPASTIFKYWVNKHVHLASVAMSSISAPTLNYLCELPCSVAFVQKIVYINICGDGPDSGEIDFLFSPWSYCAILFIKMLAARFHWIRIAVCIFSVICQYHTIIFFWMVESLPLCCYIHVLVFFPLPDVTVSFLLFLSTWQFYSSNYK